jgi:hypothetical protein
MGRGRGMRRHQMRGKGHGGMMMGRGMDMQHDRRGMGSQGFGPR